MDFSLKKSINLLKLDDIWSFFFALKMWLEYQHLNIENLHFELPQIESYLILHQINEIFSNEVPQQSFCFLINLTEACILF